MALTLALLASCAPAQTTPSSTALQNEVVVGLTWRPDADSLSYKATRQALEAAGINYVILQQAHSHDFTYDSNNMLLEGKDEHGALTPEAGKLVRCNTWQESDAAEILEGINAVVFPGGTDVSPSLYYDPQPWHGIEAETDYSAERDISDYMLMSYCLEHDIPVLSICRGTQMLSVVSGAEMVQDIPTWFEEQGLEYKNEHKQAADKDGNRDFAANDITIEKDSLLYSIVGQESLDDCPCWHHQAIRNVDGTRLVVTATTETEGVEMIEAVERTDKTFTLGVQFHPEIAVQKTLDGEANAGEYMDYNIALDLFERLEAEAEVQLEEDPYNLGLREAA